MELFFVENRYPDRIKELGDYGNILWSGLADRDESGNVFIERAGPFTPEIYFAIDLLICTENMKASLMDLGIRGVNFLPAEKRKIVSVDWQSFPPKSQIYDVLPDVNEPEDLIGIPDNDDDLLVAMPSYWNIKPQSSIKVREIARYTYKTRHTSIEAYDVGNDMADILTADTNLRYFVTGRGRKIFEKIGGNFLEFIPLRIAK